MRCSRTRVGLVAALVFLLLDGGRSWNVCRIAGGSAAPWTPGYASARPIAWPADGAAAVHPPSGARTYARHCAVCHGERGGGDGPVAAGLNPRPRDFSGGIFKYKSTPGREPPALADLRRSIGAGLRGTSMPGWRGILEPEAIDAVASHVLSLGPHTGWGSEKHLSPEIREALRIATPDAGRSHYVSLGCPACHGPAGAGDGAAAVSLKDVWNQPDPPRNLRAPWTFRGGSEPAEVYVRLAHGVSGSPMPAYGDVASPEELASVVAYIRSIADVPPWQADEPPPVAENTAPAERGRYLFAVGMCGTCHTPVDAAGIFRRDTHLLAGGVRVRVDGYGEFVSANLTPDPESGLGTWSEETLVLTLGTGVREGRAVHPWEGWPGPFLAATTADAEAMAAYLRAIPAVRNHIPTLPSRGIVERVWRGLAALRGASRARSVALHAENRGTPDPQHSTTRLGNVLRYAQAAVVLAGLLMMAFGAAPAATQAKGRAARSVLVAAALLILGLLVLQRQSEPEGEARNVRPALPLPDSAGLVSRGREVYGVAGCAFCHGADAGGGSSFSWFVNGTVWAGNLTPASGALQKWEDADILRFLSSGVRPDGRPVHWQAAVWERSANLTLHDRHALLAFIRALPPVVRDVPAPRPPQRGDPRARTIRRSGAPAALPFP